MTLGLRIREARKSKNISQGALGKAMGVTASNVSSWERDKSEPRVSDIPKLAQILKTSILWLIAGSTDINVNIGGEGNQNTIETKLLQDCIEGVELEMIDRNPPLTLTERSIIIANIYSYRLKERLSVVKVEKAEGGAK